MDTPTKQPIYDPTKTYADNFDHGPFGAFADAGTNYRDLGDPQYSFLGHPVHLPFGIPAGPLLNAKYMAAAFRHGFDVLTYKTQRTARFEVNPFPNVLYVDVEGGLTLEQASQPLIGRTTTQAPSTGLTITNSFAMPSEGPGYWVPDLQQALAAAGPGQLVIMSVVGTIKDGFSHDDYYDDFAAAAKLAAAAGAKVIEVNLSCPNVAGEGVLCYTPAAAREICRRAKEAIGDLPLLVKVGYYAPDQQELLETIIGQVAPYIAGVAAINTIPAPVVNEAGEQALPGAGRLKSGLCGAGIQWAGLDLTHRLADLRRRRGYSYQIIGVGGVMTPADYLAYRAAGADLVQSATGAMWNPHLAAGIKAALQAKAALE